MDTATADLVEKILLAFLSVIAGILAKTALDIYQLRLLRPDLLDELRQTASHCKQAFAPGEAKAAGPLCDAARADLILLIRLGARPRNKLLAGAKILRDMSVKIGLVGSTEGIAAARTIEDVRAKAIELESWLTDVNL